MNRRLWGAGLAFLCTTAAAGGYWLGRARAAGVSASKALTYSGILTDTAGAPLAGTKNIQLQLWDAAADGTMQCTVGPAPLTLVGGGFQLAVPDTCAAAVQAAPDLWAEVFVDGATLGRTKLGAVPYALEAGRAADASGALKTRIDGLDAAAVKVAGAQTVAGAKTFSDPLTATLSCPAGMLDAGAGFCMDAADRMETAYGTSVPTCAAEGKLVCNFAQLCFAKTQAAALKVTGTTATPGIYRTSDLMFYTGDNTAYYGGGKGANGLNVAAGTCAGLAPPGPHAGVLAFRCCRGKG